MNHMLSFVELASRLGAYAPASKTLSACYELEFEDREPHGVPWHTSFHASSAPWGERWCARKLVFDLLDVRTDDHKPDEMGQCIMDAGKDAEERFVERYERAGILATAVVGGLQTNFVDEEAWLSGSPDAGIVPIGWDRLHFVDFKGCDNENKKAPKFELLRTGAMACDPKYEAQIKTYVSMAERDLNFSMLLAEAGIGNAETGSVVYFNRARPHQRVEFMFDIDRSGYDAMRMRLIAAKEFFLDGLLPRQPFDGKEWSAEPCKWCEYKADVCKPLSKRELTEDVQLDLVEVAEHMVDNVDRGYDLDAKKTAVMSRWNGKD